ncbi:hypothetical protein [Telluribacter humicola]|uniref:hypothetical protein n=1 Tax=Telluribacter humicola TaxID=1720261 RepID=UPI001A97255E|nr:hypothetical protein [Telluribacter humicola]
MKTSLPLKILMLGAWLLLISSCTTDTVTPASLRGTWVERTVRQDTLIINKDGINVRRGKAPNASGYLIPKIGSGFYSYELKGGSIFISRSMFSSSMPTLFEYPVEISGKKLTLPNFYELQHHYFGEEDRSGQKTLRFERL